MGDTAPRRKVGFLHTTPATIGQVSDALKLHLPCVDPVHVYDGNVKIDNFHSPAGVTPKSNLLRWAVFADQLERAGCELIVSCCSLMPRATAFAKQVVSIPFIQLDAVILDHAVERFSRIGVLTTTEYTVPYVKEGLEERAARVGKKLELVFGGDPTALTLFNAGEFEKHDQMVLGNISELEARGVECVLMGQIPFALMGGAIGRRDWKVPVLYAGADAWARVGELLES
ncbi:MAG: hypothetical protein E4H20_09425 [Spirochaetales bacterium]|nr:MAG: hypothetical protein E4H20_09425 [Spirochaetales bacterium]